MNEEPLSLTNIKNFKVELDRKIYNLSKVYETASKDHFKNEVLIYKRFLEKLRLLTIQEIESYYD